jgi:hypothetical protein
VRGVFFLLMVLSVVRVFAEDRRGDIFPLGKVEGAPPYVQEIHIVDLGGGRRQGTGIVKDAKTGEVLVVEKAVMKGYAVESQEIEQRQIGEVYQLEVKEGQAHFRTYKVVNGERKLKDKESIEKIAENFITGPGTEAFLLKHFDELKEGKSVEALFGVFEVGRGIDFKFRKIASTEDTLTVKMKPSNFFISMMVDPIEIQLSQKDHMMIHYRGRTPVRLKDARGKWEQMDGEIIFKTVPSH